MPSPPTHSARALFNKLFMLRTERAFTGSFLIVEGGDDSQFWQRWCARELCKIEIAGGRLGVEGVIARADHQHFSGALGIVDADFSGIDGVPPSANILYTDHHDLETLLLQSSALDHVLIYYGDTERITAFETRAGHSVRDALLARGLPFGRLRWLSERRTLRLPFDRLHPARFLLDDAWQLDSEHLHHEAARLCNLTLSELHAHLDTLPEAPPWKLCQGHDLLAILHQGLGSVLGQKPPNLRTLSASLHLAYQQHELHTSTLYRDIRSWECQNPPYRILPAPLQAAS